MVKNSGFRNNVGVRNPYSVAELKLKKKINWSEKTFEVKRQLLEKAFGIPYHQLFEPSHGSPLFVKTTKNQQVMTGGGDPTPCDPYPCPTGTCKTIVNGSYTVGSNAFNDPIQGCLPDCYFIAALSALAWMAKLPLYTSPAYTYKFYKILSMGGAPILTPDIQVSGQLPLDGNGQPIHARSNTWSPTSAEIWSGVYEKAYAAWAYRQSSGITSDCPPYVYICSGNPVSALSNITGKTGNENKTKDLNNVPIAIFNKIRDGACTATLAQDKRTKYPTVAYTYKSTPASGSPYSDDTIVANHSYSVLGICEVKNDQKIITQRYIILRNPFGQKNHDPAQLQSPDVVTTGSWLNISLADLNDGIFALSADRFASHFEGFGWIVT
jgi:hypothetical protein